MTTSRCRACGASGLVSVLHADAVPVENSRLHADASGAAAVPRGDLDIEQCPCCGFVQNRAFDPDLVTYDDDYEAAQGHSPYFRTFADRVIAELLDTYDLAGARALEIGCGDGDFLRRFCAASGGTGVGVDPAVGAAAGTVDGVELRAEAFAPGSGSFGADVVLCRHTLEHVPDVAAFLRMVRNELDDRPDAICYLEIPDAGRIAAEGAFWDVYYEHCSYLDEQGLVDLLVRSGFEVLRHRLDYAGQYLVVHARPSGGRADGGGCRDELPDFSNVAAAVDDWRRWAAEQAAAERRVAVWAASSKAVAFLSCVPELEPVVAVDINPAKAGRFLPGRALEVCGPDDLNRFGVDTVLVMNPVYLDEIAAELARVGVDAELVALGS